MAQIINSDMWPEYRSNQDIIRDALYHRLHWIDQQKNRGNIPAIAAALARARLQRVLFQQTSDSAEWVQLSNDIHTTLTIRLNEGDFTGVKEFINQAMDAVDDFEEPYRTRLVEQLRNLHARAGGHAGEF